MIRLELTEQERLVLRDALESYLSDLRMEIADTDRKNFREQLKQNKEILQNILNQLKRTDEEQTNA